VKHIFVWLALLGMPLIAIATPPTTKSIEAVFELTQAEKLVDGIKPQIHGLVKAEIDKVLTGRSINAEEKKAVDNYISKSDEIISEYLKFDRLKPVYVKLYSETFTQEEVDGLVAFYKTPAGKALIIKMPKLMQSLMAVMPELLSPMMAQIQQATNQLKTAAEIARKNSSK
jgi:hypothetical protein